MTSIFRLNLAAAVATLTVLAISFILVPESLWSAITVVTTLGFAGSVGFMLCIPSMLRQKQQGSDARQLAAIGPLGLVSILLLLAMGGSFAAALAGYQKPGWALFVFGIGLFLVAQLLLNAALQVVARISTAAAQPSRHTDWQNLAASLAVQATHHESLMKLRALGETLRYSPSDVAGGSPQDTEIEQHFNMLSAQLQTNPAIDLNAPLGQINRLLVQRDIHIRAARCRT